MSGCRWPNRSFPSRQSWRSAPSWGRRPGPAGGRLPTRLRHLTAVLVGVVGNGAVARFLVTGLLLVVLVGLVGRLVVLVGLVGRLVVLVGLVSRLVVLVGLVGRLLFLVGLVRRLLLLVCP